MSEQLERGAEITKLARLLGVEPKEIGYLSAVPAAALQIFRDQVTDRLFAGDAGRLQRVAAASKLVPVPLTVKVAQISLGPVLCAATAGLLDPRHAVKVAARCPTPFLADITIHLDPRRAPEVIAAVPAQVVVAVALELLARDEHVTMGRFVSYLTKDTLRQAVREIPSDADILKVAFVMEGKENLDDLIDVARERIPGLVRTAYEQDLWAEALDLIGRLSIDNLVDIADVTTEQDDELLNSLVHAARDLNAWDVVLPVTATMNPESLRRFARIPAIVEDDVIAGIVDTALDGGMWRDLLPLTSHLPENVQAKVATYVAGKDDEILVQLSNDADEAQLWDELLVLARALPERLQKIVRARARELGREDIAAALQG